MAACFQLTTSKINQAQLPQTFGGSLAVYSLSSSSISARGAIIRIPLCYARLSKTI